uniref:Copper transport protein n=1 Tax=Peronospora matthiolae TaxID=2874970 RepID=A0AAV1U3A8_9STRA
MPKAPSVFLLLWLVLLLASAAADQNLRKTTCPLCNMDVKPDINATILGNQYVYACEMAGHIESLQNDPSANLGLPEEADIFMDAIYKDAREIKCPVCSKSFDELTHAVPWISKGAQKIYTCSKEHAQLVFDNPTKYVAAQTSSDDFCYAGAAANPTGSAMFNGFQTAIGGDTSCLLLLFQPWVITSEVKYVFSFLGVVLLAVLLEGFGELREFVEKWLFRVYSIVSRQTDYVLMCGGATPLVRRNSDALIANESLALKVGHTPQVSIVRRLPFWGKLVLAVMYMGHLSLGYLVMLVIMTFETLMFVAVVVGVGLGFVIFKDTDADKLGGSIDPCCST